MKLIVGLGNPGKEYENTRHNVGWRALEQFRESHLTEFANWFKRNDAEVFTSGNIQLLKPMTYMNLSGEAVAKAAVFYKIEHSDIIVIHDDMDVSFGEVRAKFGGGSAGHNGVKNIIEKLGHADFHRVRCGIGRPAGETSVLGHVLGRFDKEDDETLSKMLRAAAGEVQKIVGTSISEETC